MSKREEPQTPENEPHDYEPGQHYHPAYTEPLCRVCGQPKPAKEHR